MKTPPQQDAGDHKEQDAAGQPDAHSEFPSSPVMTVAALTQSAEHLALVSYRVGGLTRHTHEVGGLGEEVADVSGGLTDGDALFIRETFALVAHEEAVPVGVVHDAVEGVQAAGRCRPAHPG